MSEMALSARKFLIDEDVVRNFKEITDVLAVKKDAWVYFYIEFELDLIEKQHKQFRPNTDTVLRRLEKEMRSRPRKEESVKMSNEFIQRIDSFCKQYNFTRPMLVEFALRNACERIHLDEKLNAYRADLKVLYLLERSFDRRLTRRERVNLVRRNLIIGTIRQKNT